MKQMLTVRVGLKVAVFWASVVCLFLVVHLTQNRLQAGLESLSRHFPNAAMMTLGSILLSYAPLIKAGIFWLAMVGLASGVIREVLRGCHHVVGRKALLTVGLCGGVVLVLAALSWPEGPASMGEGYAVRSLDPFAQSSDWYHKRILMPATAHAFSMRGEQQYFIFGLMMLVVFLCLLRIWLRRYAPIATWQFVSLCTSSFVIFQLQMPGYPDALVFCCLVGALFPDVSQESKFRLLVLALLAHEASLFVGLPIALRFLDRRRQLSYLAVLGLYGFIWLGCSRFQIGAVLTSHNVDGMSGWEWIFLHPWTVGAGIFFAFKMVWAVPGMVLLRSWSRDDFEDIRFVVSCVIGGLLLATAGVDTSRMVGFAFPAVLVALKILKDSPRAPWTDRILALVFSVNLLIPSIYVGLNTGLSLGPGLYKVVWSCIRP